MGRGGSRYGAGRPGWRRKCEHLLGLDIRVLSRRGHLTSGACSSQHWSCGDAPAGSMSIRAEHDHVRLSYRVNDQPYDYAVRIERTPCRYGGTRPWFRCPRCQWRRAVIFGVASDGRFGCRRCMCLAYSSEAEATLDRLWRKQRKLEAKLGKDHQRPKGMHGRTYERVLVQIDEVEGRQDAAFCVGALSILRRGRYEAR